MPPRPRPRRGVRVHIILDRDTLARLDHLCDTADRSRSDIIGRLIDRAFGAYMPLSLEEILT